MENGQYIDVVRATYEDLVMMGVGIDNIELFLLCYRALLK